ncbi:HAD family phosphatase [Halosquirtibacter laminarini]|uniref:HAD family phosphatase n=1 Tax=Halosquirtibacter laminarini TaxID=3374600 RepID=A0AC61NEU6_9BACT|nr:HAD family phosphatase [Prolixibacteraceae bacterium]
MIQFLFDMDGLLLNTEWAWEEAIAFEFRKLVPDFDLSFFSEISGKGIFDITRWFVEKNQIDMDPLELGDLIIKRVIVLFCNEPQSMSGALQFVKDSREKGIGTNLVTSSPKVVVEAFLAETGLSQMFDTVTTGDEVHVVKPDPSIYLKAVEKLDNNTSGVAVFEDSIPGVIAAKAAGLYTVKVHASNHFDRGQDISWSSFDQQKVSSVVDALN